MNIGTKHRIVNTFNDFKFLDAAGAETAVRADVAKILIPGFATLNKEDFKAGSYLKTAAAPGVNEVATLTVTGSASAVGRNNISLRINYRSSRSEAEFSKYTQFGGKDITIGGVVAANATATDIVAELKKSLDARKARFGDLPFEFSVAAGVITVTAKESHYTLGNVSLTLSDKEGENFSAQIAKAITTASVLPIGQGSQIEENVSHLTFDGGIAGAMKADERVEMSATYDEHMLTQVFTGALAAMPKEQGAGYGTSGEFRIALLVNNKLDADPKNTLFESLFDGLLDAWNA